MARSIVLRFDAQCFDCGRSLSAGSTARWFGKGRVSCCGAPAAGAAPVAVSSPFQPGPRYSPISEAEARKVREADAALVEAERYAAVAKVDTTATDDTSFVTAERMPIIAQQQPNTRLLVRLQSGNRFIVPAVYAAHVIRCVEESCIDRVRDVSIMGEA